MSHASIATKLANKALPLENPAKTSDRRKREQEVKRDERQKVKVANKRKRSGRLVRQDASGVKGSQHPPLKGKPLVRGRVRWGGSAVVRLADRSSLTRFVDSYGLMEPLHHLWLGYISELLGVPLRGATSAVALAQEALQPSGQGTTRESSRGAPIEGPRFVSALENGTSLTQMQAWQSKFVKADFHGCKVEGTQHEALARRQQRANDAARSCQSQAPITRRACWHRCPGDGWDLPDRDQQERNQRSGPLPDGSKHMCKCR